ncbi:MAG: ATP-binding protein [Bacteroidales bacterium]|nr:ATP-binding protein [Bacteroidales bacterium]
MSTKKFPRKQLSLWHWLLIVLVVSAVISVFYNWWTVRNEYRDRLIFAERLLKGDEENAVAFFERWYQLVREDSLIFDETIDEYLKLERLEELFEASFLGNYTVSFLFCNADEDLVLRDGYTIVNCHEFFEERMRMRGRQTSHENLFRPYRNPFDFRYFGIVKISEDRQLYIEFVSREKTFWLQNTLRENRYSVVLYDHSELVRQIGFFDYPLRLFTPANKESKDFSEHERYSHLQVIIEGSYGEQVLIVSRRIPRFQNQFSTFSVAFILNLCLGLLILLVFKRVSRRLFKTFAERLQITVLAIVLGTFVLAGVVSAIQVQRLNSLKNQKVLREKTHSLLLLMEQTFDGETPNEILESPLLQQALIDFSNVFFTDIFFYDEMGYLVAKSSVEQIFQNYPRNEMDLQALYRLNQEHRNFYIQQETLGNYTFYSSYVPFRNYRNELVGYLNLPHFAQRAELRHEIMAFMVVYINLFAVLIMLAFVLVFLIIKRLTKPLVESERQIAWNEMSKQIAHEIKNPLTPMKLSVQQIQKSWNDQKDDFDSRMKNFSTVMIEQIDTLSAVASEFANFAQQPNVKLTEVNIKKCLEKTVLLMNSEETIHFEAMQGAENITVFADEKQLSRALVNILKNAKQAISEVEAPQIKISLSTSEKHVVIAIKDNGSGIPAEIRDHIFEPNFTTKTSGMGLGLAIAKNIIEQFGGTISFETEEKKTVFFVRLPIRN